MDKKSQTQYDRESDPVAGVRNDSVASRQDGASEKSRDGEWSFHHLQGENAEEHGGGGRPLMIICATVALLVVMSLLPWAKLTGNRFKDFSLVEDIVSSMVSKVTEEIIDPELQAALDEKADEEQAAQETHEAGASPQAEADVRETLEVKSPRLNGMMMIEDYAPEGSGHGLEKLGKLIDASSSRPVRIAVIGDSYIEGDIFTQDIRSLLQDRFGGSGVGFMAMHSAAPGFRRSVIQSSACWKEIDMRKAKNDTVRTLQGVYFEAGEGAYTRFEGTKKIPHADNWDCAVMTYISPVAGSVAVKVNGGTERIFEVMPSENIQSITVEGPMSKIEFNINAPGLKALGTWLVPRTGIIVDCMSMRGNSGISHKKLNRGYSRQMADILPLDLIVMEYGVNALSSKQTDYTSYSDIMIRVIGELRRNYPAAEILVLGIGDRGQKNGSEIKSLPTCRAMTDAQRRAAQKTGVMFWDIREAMGGEDAVVRWRDSQLVNADYIHLNHKGGKELAAIFIDSFIRSLR